MKTKAAKLMLLGIFSFIAFAINAFAAITISPTGQSYTVSSNFGTKTLTRTIKTFKTIDNDSAFHVLPDKLRPGDLGAATLYDCENGGYASTSEIAIIQSGKKNGYNDMEIQIALYCEATTGTVKKSTDEFYQTICSRYAAGEEVIGTGLFQIADPSGYFLRGLQLYKSGASVTYSETTSGYTGVTLEFNCSSGKCYYPEKDVKVALSTISGLNIPTNAKILSVTAEGADSISVNYGSRTLDTVTFNVIATPKTSICPTCAYVQIIVEYESSSVLSQPSLCAPTAPAGSGVNITNSSNMLVYETTGSIEKIFTIYSGTGNTSNNSNTYNSVFYPNSVILDYKTNNIVLANTITTIPNAETTCGINTIVPGGSIKSSSNNIISDDDEDPFKDISTDWSKVTNGTACDGSSYKVTSDEVSGKVDTIINNQYCNIYCKEDVKIVVPSKAKPASGNEKIFSGRYFTLPDLKVEGKKTCVADIDIAKFFRDLYGDKFNIDDIISGKISSYELLTSGDGSNWDYYNSNNWKKVLTSIKTDLEKKKEIAPYCCDYWGKVVCEGTRKVFTCTGDYKVFGESCCKYIPAPTGKLTLYCIGPATETHPTSSATIWYGLIKHVCYQAFEVQVSEVNNRDTDYIRIEAPDGTFTDAYNSSFFNQQYVRYSITPIGQNPTIIEYYDSKAENENLSKYYDTCENVAGTTTGDWNGLAITSCSCLEAWNSCKGNAAGGVGGLVSSVKHQIDVYDAIRQASYAATLKSIEDILACSEAYKYVIYNIKTPEVTFNYCDDYKIDYDFTGGINQNVKVEYCKNGATSIDFACIGEGQTQEAPIDEIDFSKFNRQISYYDCSNGYCSGSTIKTVTIPINKSVKFEYTASFRANTETKYYSILPSGVVRTKPTAVNSILLGEDGKVFPLSIGQIGNKACNYSFTFDTIGESHYENCFPELEKPMVCAFVLYNQIVNPGNGEDSTGLMYFYRPIDLNDIFPNSNNDYSEKYLAIFREIGSNWSGEKGVDAQKEIEDTGNDAYLKENLEYSYTLTPRQMARIRAYNNSQENRGNGYADFNLICNGEGQECRSSFLDGKLLGCEDKRCFSDNLNGNPSSREVTFKSYSNGTSWK